MSIDVSFHNQNDTIRSGVPTMMTSAVLLVADIIAGIGVALKA
jgi:hypothetical protein